MAALRFPAHFPPSTPMKKFFIGVRWLGPDLSFFRDLKDSQGARSLSDMSAWDGATRSALACQVSAILATSFGWKSPYFLPDDAAIVAFHGPRFDFNGPGDAVGRIEEMLLKEYGVRVPSTIWREAIDDTMGQLIDRLLALLPLA